MGTVSIPIGVRLSEPYKFSASQHVCRQNGEKTFARFDELYTMRLQLNKRSAACSRLIGDNLHRDAKDGVVRDGNVRVTDPES